MSGNGLKRGHHDDDAYIVKQNLTLIRIWNIGLSASNQWPWLEITEDLKSITCRMTVSSNKSQINLK